jgi:putative Mn2+ efflux pump MntP
MFLPVAAGLVVSVDALFIGISLGLQKKCKFWHIAVINAFLLGLCIVGFFVAGQIYAQIPFDPDLVVGFAFIALGLWTILQYFASTKTIAIAGVVMSIEAMIITMGLTFVFLPHSTLAIPITVALAHFGYCTLTFYLARTKQVQKIPLALCHAISGLALIAYGLMALFVDIWDVVA